MLMHKTRFGRDVYALDSNEKAALLSAIGTRMTGGRGKVIGTFFGVLILGILNNMMNLMNVSPHLQGFVKGLIIIVAVVFQKRE